MQLGLCALLSFFQYMWTFGRNEAKLSLCIFHPLSVESYQVESLGYQYGTVANWIASSLVALKDVTGQRTIVFDLQDFEPKHMALALTQSYSVGCDARILLTNSAQISLGVPLTSFRGSFMTTGIASSPSFSDKAIYSNLVRTVISEAEAAQAVLAFSEQLGWEQAVLIHLDTWQATNDARVLADNIHGSGLSVERIWVEESYTMEALENALSRLKNSQIKVVIIDIGSYLVREFLSSARDFFTDDFDSYVWLGLAKDGLDLPHSVEDPPLLESGIEEILSGYVGVVTDVHPYATRNLQDDIQRNTETLKIELWEAFSRGVNQNGSVCAAADELEACGDIGRTIDRLIDAAARESAGPSAAFAHDAALAAAYAVTEAVKNSSARGEALGPAVASLIRGGGIPGFEGATGFIRWDPRGDRVADNLTVSFRQYSGQEGVPVEVGRWSSREGLVIHGGDRAITWADGTTGVENAPSDGRDTGDRPGGSGGDSSAYEVDVCLFFPLFSDAEEEGAEPEITLGAALYWAAAALLAVEHVNSQNCTLLGGDCQSLITVDGAPLRINPLVYDLKDFTPNHVAPAGVRCAEAGGRLVLGATTSGQSSMATQLAAVSGQILVSSIATSPSLSDKDLYASFARTCYSDGGFAYALVMLAEEFGWKQMAVLHNRDLYGNGYADAFTSAMLESGKTANSISLGAIVTEENVRSAMRQLKASGFKIVVVVAFSDDWPLIMTLASEILAGDFKSYVWFSGATDAVDPIRELSEEEDAATLELFESVIGVSTVQGRQGVDALMSYVQGGANQLEQSLRDGLTRSVLREGQSCAATVSQQTAEEASAVAQTIRMPSSVVSVLESISTQTADQFFPHSYDMVWAGMSGVAEAIRSSGSGEVPMGSALLPLIRAEAVPAFEGAAGSHRWTASGDPALSGLRVSYTQYAKRRSDDKAGVEEVATWSEQEGVVILPESSIVWADGSRYPKIPSDGTTTSKLHIYLASGLSATVFVVVVVALIYRREQAKKTNPLIGINVNKVLKQIYDDVKDIKDGKVADYIPELTKANPEHFAIALCTKSGKIYSVGDTAAEFTIQSASKPFMYALLLEMTDSDYVKSKINVEPSGEAFNSDKLSRDGRPFNPLINQGAIACCALAAPMESAAQRFDKICDLMSSCATRQLRLDNQVYQSEKATGFQNQKIAQVLRSSGCVETDNDRDEGLDAYFMGCSVLVDVKELAVMGATIANKGKNPKTRKQVMEPDHAQAVNSVMMSCGMYNGAGNWMMDVGLPAKSGVSGCLLVVVPGICGMAVYSPKLNEHGNSVRGIEACTLLSSQLNLHVLSKKDRKGSLLSSTMGSQAGRSIMRSAIGAGTEKDSAAKQQSSPVGSTKEAWQDSNV